MAKYEEKHRWLQEVAISFGMDTKQLAKCMGYSRKMLYQVSAGMTKANPGRLGVAIYKLESISAEILEKDLKSAQEAHKKRMKLLDYMYERLQGRE